MKAKMKKYPLLISMIVSCAIIIASLFILGFFGLKLGTSLGGGSQFEVKIPVGESTKEYVSEIKSVLKDNDLSFDSSIVEDKYITTDDEGNFTKQVLIVKISESNVSDETESALIADISEKLEIDKSYISNVDDITSFTTGKNVLKLGIAIAIVAVALFVFAWIRYDVFAGLSFIVSFLHNIILYLSLVILTRLELNLTSLSVAFILTLVMSIILIHIYEKYRKEAKLHISDNLTINERMINAEKESIKPFAIIFISLLVVLAFMMFVPATVVKFTALNIFVSLIVTAYTSMIIGPASYVALLDIRDVRHKAVLSRNDTVNKVIKKKIKKSQEEKEENKKKESLKEVEQEQLVQEKVETPVQVEKKKTYSKPTKKKGSKKNTWSKK